VKEVKKKRFHGVKSYVAIHSVNVLALQEKSVSIPVGRESCLEVVG